jgi:hypothetical protein
MPPMSQARARIKNTVTAHVFNIVGTGETVDDAQAELEAKLALVGGTLLSASRSEQLDITTLAAPVNGPGGDAIVYLQVGSDTSTRVGININNMAGTFKDATKNDGSIILTGAVAAFAAAYIDGQGNTGYTAVGGRFLD